MMTILKNRIETAALSMSDINLSLRSVTKYCWMAAGIFFIAYLYLVGSITFTVIKQQSLAQNIKTIVSDTSREELKYLNLQKELSVGYAIEKGFVSAESSKAVTYVTASRNFAWNFKQ